MGKKISSKKLQRRRTVGSEFAIATISTKLHKTLKKRFCLMEKKNTKKCSSYKTFLIFQPTTLISNGAELKFFVRVGIKLHEIYCTKYGNHYGI